MVSGRSTHPDPDKNLLDIDPDKFAILPSMSLLYQLGGAFHATSCRNLSSIMAKGILPGADVEDDYNRRHESGRVHSHYGIFALCPMGCKEFNHEDKGCWTPQQAHANGGALHSIS